MSIQIGDLGLISSICHWIMDFLTGGPQEVRMGNHTSSTLTFNIGAPQGCVLSPVLYSLYTSDCMAKHSSDKLKFADDTIVLGIFSKNNEKAYLEEVDAECC